MLRTCHRWLAVIAGTFLVFIAATGIALQLDLLLSGRDPPGTVRERLGPPRQMPDQAALDEITATVIETMRDHQDISVERIEYHLSGPRLVATVGAVNRFAPSVRVDLDTGTILPPAELEVSFHRILQDLHAGYFVGLPGHIFSILSGLALLILSVTGLKVYVDMYRRRRKAGKDNPFWK